MSKVINLKHYQLVFTTSFENLHGVSGHLYEMIDYYFVATASGIKSAILLTDGTTKELFVSAVKIKYAVSPQEMDQLINDTIECANPKIIMVQQLCVVDGNPRFNSCTIYADHIWLLRCSAGNFDYFHNHKSIKHTTLLQDFAVYPERYEHLNIDVIDYNKKILWSKYTVPATTKTDTGLLYLTTNCRGIEPDRIADVMERSSCGKHIIVTNAPEKYQELQSDTVQVVSTPVENIFEKFDTYIYTPIPTQFDCSPRFIVECAIFGKQVKYEIEYVDPGIESRKRAMETDINSLLLTSNDDFIKYVKEML